MSMPIIPPFAIAASYQNSQYGSGSIYTPGVPSVFTNLVSPPSTGVAAETWSSNQGIADGFVDYSAVNETLLVTILGSPISGTFQLEFGDDITGPIAYNATATAVGTALSALASITTGSGGTNEQQLVTISNATSGTFTLTYSGQTTGAIAYNAAASAVQTAIQALSNVGAGNATVTGSAGGPYTVTFAGTLADTNVAQMTASAGSLVGSSTTAVVTTTTGGVANTPNIAVTGSAGGPWTVAFAGTLGDEFLQGFSGNGAGLVGGTDPSVEVTVTTEGSAAFLNQALLNVKQQFDPLVNFYDNASNGSY
jgi:hypothetical protein